MSLILTVYVGEGIVMASDSRMVYNNTNEINLPHNQGKKIINNHGVHFSESSYKTFVMKNDIGISLCGEATINNKPIASYMESFIRANQDIDIDEVPNKILNYFNELSPNLNTLFHVAGYKKTNGDYEQRLYRISTQSKNFEKIDTTNQGAAWNGESDVISRLFSELYIKVQKTGNSNNDFKIHTGYPIMWQYFTLQDAIEFAQYAMNTTINTMKFQLRVKTVGGPVDILIIKPTGFSWIAKKELHV